MDSMEKGKRPRNVEEDDFLQLLITEYENECEIVMASSPLSETPANPNYNILSDGDHENFISNVSSESSGSGSKRDHHSVVDEMEGLDEEEFFSKFLALSNPVSPVDVGSSNLPCENSVSKPVHDDPYSMVSDVPETAVQPPTPSIEIAATTRGRPRGLRKAMPPEKLAELSKQDPKKAKRIITNRMSAVRAKEKKKLYTCMLEHKIQTLQAEAATLSAHLSLLQSESIGLNAENARLKEQTGNVMRQIRFQDSLNDEIRNEIQSLINLTQTKSPSITFNIGNFGYYNPLAAMGSNVSPQHFQPWLPNPYQQMNIMNGQQRPWQWQLQQAQSAPNPHLHHEQHNLSPISNREESAGVENPVVEENPPSDQMMAYHDNHQADYDETNEE